MEKIFIQLGRAGDVLNILPAVEHEYKITKEKPRLMVAQAYYPIIEGLSYLKPTAFPGNFRLIRDAVILAKRKFTDTQIVNCAVFGERYNLNKQCNSFLREAWRLSGCPEAWGRRQLLIDNRDKNRERELKKKLIGNDSKPIILLAFRGNSSPFDKATELMGFFRQEFKDYHLIDTSNFAAQRFQDMLAIYEVAELLITIDSAPLHLAKATPRLPLIALYEDRKDSWQHSDWTPQQRLRFGYSEVMQPANLKKIVELVRSDLKYEPQKIWFTTSYNPTAPAERLRRIQFATSTLKDLPGKGRWKYIRSLTLDRKSSEGLPYVKEMIDNVAKHIKKPSDIIVIMNADICVVPGITSWILDKVNRSGSAYFHRHDFKTIDKTLILESQVRKGKWYCGSDMFAFTKQWWINNRTIFPDLIFAREGWDMLMRNMIKRTGGDEIHNAIYHQDHSSFWESAEGRTCEGNRHNKNLGVQWLKTYGGNWNDWKYDRDKLRYK